MLSKRINIWTFIITIISLGILYRFTIKIYGNTEYPNHVHTTIYIDSNFDDFEEQTIMEAALEWTATTNHIIEYDIVKLPINHKIDLDHSLIITKQTANYPNVVVLDFYNKMETLAFYDPKTIIPSIAVISERIEVEDYKAVIMHELGHSLGLVHNDGIDGFDSLMYPTRDVVINGVFIRAGSDHLTLQDGKQFCKLYHCDHTKLKYQKESLHF